MNVAKSAMQILEDGMAQQVRTSSVKLSIERHEKKIEGLSEVAKLLERSVNPELGANLDVTI